MFRVKETAEEIENKTESRSRTEKKEYSSYKKSGVTPEKRVGVQQVKGEE